MIQVILILPPSLPPPSLPPSQPPPPPSLPPSLPTSLSTSLPPSFPVSLRSIPTWCSTTPRWLAAALRRGYILQLFNMINLLLDKEKVRGRGTAQLVLYNQTYSLKQSTSGQIQFTINTLRSLSAVALPFCSPCRRHVAGTCCSVSLVWWPCPPT